jgi:hypothetical protein
LPAFSQQTWQRTYGGPNSDRGWSVQQTTDGGYVIAGETGSFGAGNGDVYLVKTDANGDTLWTKTYGGTTIEECYSVQQTTDGGYILAGRIEFGPGNGDVYLVKTKSNGDILWTRHYGWVNDDYANSVRQTLDGGYIITGATGSFGAGSYDVYLIKTDANGDTLWTRYYGFPSWDEGYSVKQTADSGYIVSGSTYSFGTTGWDVYLLKTNANGDTLWTRTYGGANDDQGGSVQQTSDGGYIIAGETWSFGAGREDAYLIKTNAQGDTLWTRTFGGIYDDGGYWAQQTTDGGYILAGWATSFGAGSHDAYLIKTDSLGDTLWTRTFGGTEWDDAYSVEQTTDGGYILGGDTWSYGAGNGDVYLVKTDANGNVGVEENRDQGFKGSRIPGYKATPNPFSSFATIPGHSSDRFTLYDVSGRKVGTYRGDRIGNGLSAGVYFLRPEGANAKPLRVVKIR